MSEIFFTADTHFGHRFMLSDKIDKPRPWASVEEMNEALIEAWNSVVGEKDEVYHLGDISFAKDDETIPLVKRLNGRIKLVKGNHDKRFKTALTECFEWVKDYYELRGPEKKKIVLSHYALLIWNKSHWGSWHLHGHSHGNLDAFNKEQNVSRMDVGVDTRSDYAPYSMEEITQAMEGTIILPFDHHTPRNR